MQSSKVTIDIKDLCGVIYSALQRLQYVQFVGREIFGNRFVAGFKDGSKRLVFVCLGYLVLQILAFFSDHTDFH